MLTSNWHLGGNVFVSDSHFKHTHIHMRVRLFLHNECVFHSRSARCRLLISFLLPLFSQCVFFFLPLTVRLRQYTEIWSVPRPFELKNLFKTTDAASVLIVQKVVFRSFNVSLMFGASFWNQTGRGSLPPRESVSNTLFPAFCQVKSNFTSCLGGIYNLYNI